MRHLRMIGLCLVAAFALGAVMSATASAELPEVVECAKAAKLGKKYTGDYTDKKCSKEASAKEIEEGKTNKYVLRPWDKEPSKVKAFKGKGAGSNLDVVGLGEVTCTSSTDEGKFTGPKTAGGIKVTFKGCEVDHEKCHSKSAASGEIKTNTLDGEVGYINKATKEVGADLKAESGPYEAEFECGVLPLDAVVKGSVIGIVEPINKFTKEATFTFERLGTTQLPSKLEGGLPDTLVVEECGACNPIGSGEKESGMQNEVVNKGEELELLA